MARRLDQRTGLISNAESMFLIRGVAHHELPASEAITAARGQLAGSDGRIIVVNTTTAVVKVGVDVWVLDAHPPHEQRALA